MPGKRAKELDAIVIVIGPNVWGKGKTVTEARKNAGRPKKYSAYLCPSATEVCHIYGNLQFPVSTFRPFLVESVGVKT